MDVDDFKNMRGLACELFESQPPKDKLKISLDAVFIALANQAQPRKGYNASEEEVPEWFTETLDKLKGSGERMTISRFLLLAGKFPTTRADSLAAGRWLREAGFEPKKIGGNLLFEL